MGDSFARAAQTQIDQMIMSPPFVENDLPAEKDRKLGVLYKDMIELGLRITKNPDSGNAPGGMAPGHIRQKGKSQECARNGKIEDLTSAIIDECRERDPATRDNEVGAAFFALPVEFCSGRENAHGASEAADFIERVPYRHDCLLFRCGGVEYRLGGTALDLGQEEVGIKERSAVVRNIWKNI
ncbi:MAG TPA: hypothetical protein VHB49_23015 [Bradyrhizobium sp.]|nr:hypothetical protein [Bradyrhizobium sp.]